MAATGFGPPRLCQRSAAPSLPNAKKDESLSVDEVDGDGGVRCDDIISSWVLVSPLVEVLMTCSESLRLSLVFR